MRRFRDYDYYLNEAGECFRHYPERDYVYTAKFEKKTYQNAYSQPEKLKQIMPTPIKNGYMKYTIFKDGVSLQAGVHRMVWEAYNGPIGTGLEIHHIDGNPANNRLNNLEIVSREKNLQYRKWSR